MPVSEGNVEQEHPSPSSKKRSREEDDNTDGERDSKKIDNKDVALPALESTNEKTSTEVSKKRPREDDDTTVQREPKKVDLGES